MSYGVLRVHIYLLRVISFWSRMIGKMAEREGIIITCDSVADVDWTNVSTIESEDMQGVTLLIVASEHHVTLVAHTHLTMIRILFHLVVNCYSPFQQWSWGRARLVSVSSCTDPPWYCEHWLSRPCCRSARGRDSSSCWHWSPQHCDHTTPASPHSYSLYIIRRIQDPL